VPRPTRGSAIVEQAPARARHESDVLLDQAGSSNGALDERRRLDAVRVDADSRGGVPQAIRRERRQRVFAARRLHRGLRAT
jgi:hypothetical protein